MESHRTLFNASLRGDRDELLRLVAKRAEWDVHAINGAAMGGSVECMRLALASGAPFDPASAAMLAAQKGHLSALKFVHGEALARPPGGRMEWHPSTLYWAALNDNAECVRYLLAHMRPLTMQQVEDALAVAKLFRCRACMFCLHGVLYPYTYTPDEAMRLNL